MYKEKVPRETKNSICNFYRKADKYAQRLDLHKYSACDDYITFVRRFIEPRAKILDLGCGTGLSSFRLSEDEYVVVGMDISYACIEKAKKKERKNPIFICSDVLNIPFKNETFDCVGIFLVIEHIPDIPRVINEMLRVTKQGGKIIILSPNLLSPFNVLFPVPAFGFDNKVNYLFGANNLWKRYILLVKNTALLIKKKFCRNPSFIYREPVLENQIDFIADNDAVYLCCPVDFKNYFRGIANAKIINYQGYGKIGKILPDFSTGIYIVVEKM